ncbi:quinol-cytochrome oxidoreductase complex cytochrome b subunit [Catalinimonas alkaloidigena]|nr:quinol-cytochrome oxidoreductase complex cytochrome b subunit [Catalinimonas alkaloidigena]
MDREEVINYGNHSYYQYDADQHNKKPLRICLTVIFFLLFFLFLVLFLFNFFNFLNKIEHNERMPLKIKGSLKKMPEW